MSKNTTRTEKVDQEIKAEDQEVVIDEDEARILNQIKEIDEALEDLDEEINLVNRVLAVSQVFVSIEEFRDFLVNDYNNNVQAYNSGLARKKSLQELLEKNHSEE